MRRIWHALTVVPVLSLGLMALMGPMSTAQASARHIVKVKGVARNGRTVRVQPTIVDARTGQPYVVGGYIFSGGRTIRLPAGRYEIAAPVPTFGANGADLYDTLVARFVTIRGRTTVRLNAGQGRRLDISLRNAPGAAEQSESATVCLRSGPSNGEPVTASNYGGPIFVAPLATGRLPFSYESTWQGQQPGVYYDLAGRRRGIPARPSYHVDAAHLAQVRLSARSGTSISDTGGWNLAPGPANSLCSDSSSGLPAAVGGPGITDYRTPGRWSTDLSMQLPNGDDYANWYLTRTYRAGRVYHDTFTQAVRGPAFSYPEIQGDFFDYAPTGYFSDPVLKGFECCSRAAITLRFRSRVLKRATMTDWRSQRDFTRFLHRTGWYTLQVEARRFRGSTTIPSRILSPRVSLRWRFHVRPGPRAGNWQSMPVTLTRFLPAGLDAANDAAAGSTTPVRFHIVRAPNQDLPTPRFPWRTVRIGASFDGGATWHALRFHRSGSSGVASVPNPASAGFVSLRITVIDAHGNSTVETIYRAYGVS